MRRFVYIFMLLLFVTGLQARAEGDYVYPITPESEDWFHYTPKEKAEMLKIDEETLNGMSDRQLVRAVATFPYLGDIHVYGTMNDSVPLVEKYCSALGELITRDSFRQSLVSYGNELIEEYKMSEKKNAELIIWLMTDLIDYYMNPTEDPELIYPDGWVKSAPSVPYTVKTEAHSVTTHDNLDQMYVLSVYNVSGIRVGSCKYNCHSYAWHSQSVNNIYWINDPTGYTTSGNYTYVYGGNVSSNILYSGVHMNDKIFYQAPSTANMHSAIFIDNPYSGTPLAQALVESKWGIYGVFHHRLTEVPSAYDYSYISIWH